MTRTISSMSPRRRLRRWLKDHHNSSPGIWLVTHKKGAGEKYLAYEDIVCEALCYGWIDSKVRTLDGLRSQLLYPAEAERQLVAAEQGTGRQAEAGGRMAAPGRAMVELAKASGTWTALDDVENPRAAELATALNAYPEARNNWDAFPRSTGGHRWISNWEPSDPG